MKMIMISAVRRPKAHTTQASAPMISSGSSASSSPREIGSRMDSCRVKTAPTKKDQAGVPL